MGGTALSPRSGRELKLRWSIAAVSAAALSYEILLMRLFSIIQWHHFAYMIISLALLGYGVSGTFLALVRERLMRRFDAAYVVNLLLFAGAATGCFAVAQRISFNAEELLWDPRQVLRFMTVCGLLFLPFFFAANAIGLALSRQPSQAPRIYASDLIGAAVGCLVIILVLYLFFPSGALRIVSCVGLLGALLALWELRLFRAPSAAAVIIVGLAVAAMPAAWLEPRISPYKGLSQILRLPGTRVVDRQSSPLGLITVVESSRVPLRHAPGLSLNATAEPPPQLGIFTDGDGLAAITRFRGDLASLAYLDQSTSALPYHLSEMRRVLVLGAGGGGDVLQALYHKADGVDAVEINPQVARLLTDRYAEFAGNLFSDPKVRLHIGEARGFVARTEGRYDLIQLALIDAFGASSAGLYALNENYLYTVEALQEYMNHLAPDGYLAITRWIKMPPRDGLKLFATAVEALKNRGSNLPELRLAMIRGWQTGTLVIKNGVFGSREIERLRRFCAERGFDPVYYPGMPPTEANRRNVLREPYFYIGARRLLGSEHAAFFDEYKFNLSPPTDDRPYFFHFFKWRALPEILSLRGSGGMSLLESGYLVLVATLGQAVLFSIILILLPLAFKREFGTARPPHQLRIKVLVYFFSIGLGFLFIEIAFIQKFILFLVHPLYAVTIILCSFLLFAGVGSAWVEHRRATEHLSPVAFAIAGIVAFGAVYTAGLDDLFRHLAWLPDLARIVLSILLIAPLGFFMGMPFPLAMRHLGNQAPTLVPWAWGINGCASVVSVVLATLIAVQFGFTVLLLSAFSIYVVALVCFPDAN